MTNANKMGDFINEAKRILSEIDSRQEIHENQLNTYKEIINTSIAFNKERMEAFDKQVEKIERRWTATRNVMIGILSVFMLSFVSDKYALQNRPTTEDIQKDYPTKTDVLQGFGAVIEDNYNTYETLDLMTHDEAEQLKSEAESDVLKQVDPAYKTRSIKTK